MRRFSWLALACTASLVLFGCDDEESDDGSTDAASECAASDSPALLQIDNQTGNTMAEVTMRACDGSDLVMFPLPDGGLATGSETTIDLPAPGCWILSYAGEGCFNDPKHQTPIAGVCGGETHVWQASSATHTCAGAGW